MQAVLDNSAYAQLLSETLPRRIKTEEENERYLAIVEDLIDKGAENFSPAEDELFDLLTVLIEDFEEKAYPMPNVSVGERIKYLLEENNLRQKDLAASFGSEGVVSDIISGRREMTLKSAHKLADFFSVPVEMFL